MDETILGHAWWQRRWQLHCHQAGKKSIILLWIAHKRLISPKHLQETFLGLQHEENHLDTSVTPTLTPMLLQQFEYFEFLGVPKLEKQKVTLGIITLHCLDANVECTRDSCYF